MKQEIDILSSAFSSQRLEKYINLYNGDVTKVSYRLCSKKAEYLH